jgi:hypothetical protein
MILLISISLTLALIGLFCFRHFILQVFCLKLLGDCILLILSCVGNTGMRTETGSYAWIVLALEGAMAFLIFIGGIKALSRSTSLRVWGEHE